MIKNLSKVYSAELEGIDAKIIEVETDLNVGLHSFNIVGLADKALNEAKERVNSALKNIGVKPPNRENRRITINLAPADIKKTGSQYDLAIAIGYLLSTKQIKDFNVCDKVFIGELALDGRLRKTRGALNIAQAASGAGFKFLLLPKVNAGEAAVIKNIKVIPIEHFREAIEFLEERRKITPAEPSFLKIEKTSSPDFSEIKGQENAKRAAMIAAAGGHNLLMTGPPGVGKSLLASSLAKILPKLTLDEAVEVTKIHSAAGLNPRGLIQERPVRTPHQTSSSVAIVGGGADPRPGEISLAHRGVLFLDELPEFNKNVLESLRQPLESGIIHVARAKNTLIFPARFTLVAAMNPCPCGFYGDEKKECRCSAYEVIKYNKKISGPLLDRIDIQINVPRVEIAELQSKSEGITSIAAQNIVETARKIQKERLKQFSITTNSEVTPRQLEATINIEPEAKDLLKKLGANHLSPRGYYRTLKVARTVADLETKDSVSKNHLAEAFSYRLREN